MTRQSLRSKKPTTIPIFAASIPVFAISVVTAVSSIVSVVAAVASIVVFAVTAVPTISPALATSVAVSISSVSATPAVPPSSIDVRVAGPAPDIVSFILGEIAAEVVNVIVDAMHKHVVRMRFGVTAIDGVVKIVYDVAIHSVGIDPIFQAVGRNERRRAGKKKESVELHGVVGSG